MLHENKSPLLTPQLFCEADTRPIGECPCVKCFKTRTAGALASKYWADRQQEMMLDIIRKGWHVDGEA